MFRFLFLADMQLGAYASFSGMSPAEAARYAELGMRVEPTAPVEGIEWDARRYREAVAAANALRPDLVVIGGDMVDDPNAEEQYDEFMRISSRLDREIPIRWVPGNHDIAADTVVPTPESITRYREAFGPDYYAFEGGPARFIALNTTVVDHPEHVPGEWEAQLAFLQVELSEAKRRERTAVLVGHHPLFKHRPDEPDDYWNLPTERRRRILELVHRHRVPLALAGHWHRNASGRDGDFQMVTSGPVGYPLGDDPPGFRVVEITRSRIEHRYVPLSG